MADPLVFPHPDVRVPPPLVYVAGFVLGWLVDRRWPLAIAGEGHDRARMVIAAIFLCIWLALMASAVAAFVAARTAILPIRPATAIVTTGPYRLTRNPMYLGLASLHVGAALLANSWWPLIVLPFVLLVIDRAVIAREERYLRVAFPVEYAAYCARVRRWL